LSDFTPVAALSRDLDFSGKFLTEFQDRMYFGSDLCNIEADVPQTRFFQMMRDKGYITQEVYDKITYKNAEKLFAE
jgi:predicted TIM-barrel fold metal-dependent hydrolase